MSTSDKTPTDAPAGSSHVTSVAGTVGTPDDVPADTPAGSPARSSADQAYERLKRGILDGEYLPSQRLVESKLADALGVSRHNVRVALDRLHSDGLVVLEPNRGASVATLTLAQALDVLQAREALEVGVGRIAAERIGDDDLRVLQDLVAAMRGALESSEYDRYSATNQTFHRTIYRASGNETLPELIEQTKLRLARLQLRTILIPGRGERSLAEHEAILAALEAGDPDAAERALRTHMSNLRQAIEKAWALLRL